MGHLQSAGEICAVSPGQDPGPHMREALLSAPNEHDVFPSLSPSGTPTEDTWPGITSNEEFKAYNFTQYRAQPLINHAPRYLLVQGHTVGLCWSSVGAWGEQFHLLLIVLAASESSCALEVLAATCPLH